MELVVGLMLIGVVHRLEGRPPSALLVIRTIRDPTWAIIYLLVCGAGTIAGMIIITTAIAMPLASFGTRALKRHASFRVATGLASVALGLFLASRIVVIVRLFAAVPLL